MWYNVDGVFTANDSSVFHPPNVPYAGYGPEAWYYVDVPPGVDTFVVETCGAPTTKMNANRFDTILAVFNSCPRQYAGLPYTGLPAASLVASNDDAGTAYPGGCAGWISDNGWSATSYSTQSLVRLQKPLPGRYWIMIDGVAATDFGDYSIFFTFLRTSSVSPTPTATVTPAVPTPSACCARCYNNTVPLIGDVGSVAVDFFNKPSLITYTVPSATPGALYRFVGAEVVFILDLSVGATRLFMTTCNGSTNSTDTVISLLTSCPFVASTSTFRQNAGELAWNDDDATCGTNPSASSLTVNDLPAGRYYILVDSYRPTTSYEPVTFRYVLTPGVPAVPVTIPRARLPDCPYAVAPSATPSVTPTASPSPSSTPSPTVSPAASVTSTASATTTLGGTPTPTLSVMPTLSLTPSATPTRSISASSSVTPSATRSRTTTVSVTPSSSGSPSVSRSVTPTMTITPSVTPSASVTPSGTATRSITPSGTPSSPTISPTSSATPSVTPTPSTTMSLSRSATPSLSGSQSPSPSRSASPPAATSKQVTQAVTPLLSSSSRLPPSSAATTALPSNGPLLFTAPTCAFAVDATAAAAPPLALAASKSVNFLASMCIVDATDTLDCATLLQNPGNYSDLTAALSGLLYPGSGARLQAAMRLRRCWSAKAPSDVLVAGYGYEPGSLNTTTCAVPFSAAPTVIARYPADQGAYAVGHSVFDSVTLVAARSSVLAASCGCSLLVSVAIPLAFFSVVPSAPRPVTSAFPPFEASCSASSLALGTAELGTRYRFLESAFQAAQLDSGSATTFVFSGVGMPYTLPPLDAGCRMSMYVGTYATCVEPCAAGAADYSLLTAPGNASYLLAPNASGMWAATNISSSVNFSNSGYSSNPVGPCVPSGLYAIEDVALSATPGVAASASVLRPSAATVLPSGSRAPAQTTATLVLPAASSVLSSPATGSAVTATAANAPSNIPTLPASRSAASSPPSSSTLQQSTASLSSSATATATSSPTHSDSQFPPSSVATTPSASGTVSSSPAPPAGSLNTSTQRCYASLSVGGFHGLALSRSGTVTGFGEAAAGQLDVPPSLAGQTLAVAAGGFFSCALHTVPRSTNATTVSCWGGGGGSSSAAVTVVPPGVVSDGGVVALAAGGYHACVVLGNASVVCWGANGAGQCSPLPAAVSNSGVTALALGAYHSCATLSGSTAVACWGRDDFGQVSGVPPALARGGSPLRLVCGGYHCCGWGATTPLTCWGAAAAGQTAVPPAVAGALNVSDVCAGGYFSCAVVSGAAACWGGNTRGETAVPPGARDGSVAAVACGWYSACALKTDGSFVCWGGDLGVQAAAASGDQDVTIATADAAESGAATSRTGAVVISTGAVAAGASGSGVSGTVSIVSGDVAGGGASSSGPIVLAVGPSSGARGAISLLAPVVAMEQSLAIGGSLTLGGATLTGSDVAALLVLARASSGTATAAPGAGAAVAAAGTALPGPGSVTPSATVTRSSVAAAASMGGGISSPSASMASATLIVSAANASVSSTYLSATNTPASGSASVFPSLTRTISPALSPSSTPTASTAASSSPAASATSTVSASPTASCSSSLAPSPTVSATTTGSPSTTATASRSTTPSTSQTRTLTTSSTNTRSATASLTATPSSQPILTVTTRSGNGTAGISDSPGNVTWYYPGDMLYNPADGFMYVTDLQTLRRISVATGATTKLAGVVGVAGHRDGVGAAAVLGSPSSLQLSPDGGTLYWNDVSSFYLRYMTLSTLNVGTLAGNGTGSTIDNIRPLNASFNWPTGLVLLPNGDFVVSESVGKVLRYVGLSSGVVTVAGLAGAIGAVDGIGAAARFLSPAAIALAPDNATVYVSEGYGGYIRRVTVGTWEVSTVAGAGCTLPPYTTNRQALTACINTGKLLYDALSNRLLWTDSQTNTVQALDFATGNAVLVAGPDPAAGGASAGYVDGPSSVARFNSPAGLSFDGAKNLWVADYLNHVLRVIVASPTGSVGATQAPQASPAAASAAGALSSSSPTPPATSASPTPTPTSTLSPSSTRSPTVTPSPSPSPLYVATVAGTGVNAYTDGPALNASFTGNFHLGVDAQDNVYVTTGSYLRVRMLNVTTNQVSTVAGDGTGGLWQWPCGMAFTSDGTMYIGWGHQLLTYKGGARTVLAGNATAGYADGPAASALFNYAQGVALQSAGASANVVVADGGNRVLRLFNATTNSVSTLAGAAGVLGCVDGAAASARFGNPFTVASLPSGDIVISDSTCTSIRLLNVSTGMVSTIVNVGTTPQYIAVDQRTAYIYHTSYMAVYRIKLDGNRTIVAGGNSGYVDGLAPVAQFSTPLGIGVDSQGRIYVADQTNYRIRRIG